MNILSFRPCFSSNVKYMHENCKEMHCHVPFSVSLQPLWNPIAYRKRHEVEDQRYEPCERSMWIPRQSGSAMQSTDGRRLKEWSKGERVAEATFQKKKSVVHTNSLNRQVYLVLSIKACSSPHEAHSFVITVYHAKSRIFLPVFFCTLVSVS